MHNKTIKKTPILCSIEIQINTIINTLRNYKKDNKTF